MYSQVTIYRIECSLQFARIKLLETKSNNDSKHSRANNTQLKTADQTSDGQTDDSKVTVSKY